MKKIYRKIVLTAGLFFLMSASGTAQTTYSYTGSTDTYIVPAGVGSISIEAKGSKGLDGASSTGGNGATMYGEFTVSPGDVLTFYVGGNSAGIKAGGDGSWVENTTTGTLLIVAGGGGGATHSKNGAGAPVTEDGTASISHDGYADGAPGTGGNGGGAGTGAWGTGGGGGWLSAGADGTGSPGGAMPCMASYGTTFAAGAGGGYSGGGGVDMDSGWGTGGGGAGGSYNIGTAQANVAADNAALGEITIDELCNVMSTTVSDDTVCVGDMVTLSATGAGTISWDGGVIDGEAFTPPTGSTTYTATSDDDNDCPFSIVIFVGELPTVDAGTDVSACEGDEVTLSGTGTATDWSWDGGVDNGVPFTPTAGTTTYTLTGTIDSTGCMATDEVDVTVNAVDVSMSIAGGSLMANQAGATYQWLECPDYTPISGETDQTFTPSADADYAVEVTYEGCVDTSICQVVHVGFDENESPLNAKVYPNPTNGQTQIVAEGQFNYVLMNVLGETILSGSAVAQTTIDLEEMAVGTYFVKVSANEETKTFKLIKE
jgi:hypothetical protein